MKAFVGFFSAEVLATAASSYLQFALHFEFLGLSVLATPVSAVMSNDKRINMHTEIACGPSPQGD